MKYNVIKKLAGRWNGNDDAWVNHANLDKELERKLLCHMVMCTERRACMPLTLCQHLCVIPFASDVQNITEVRLTSL